MKNDPKPSASQKSAYKVLVAEDEGLIAQDIATRLAGLGHEVIGIVETGHDAIAMAPQAEVVLMDIRLDGSVDGIQAASKIRDQHGPPVIFLTAHTDHATLQRAKATGPFGYLVKPLAQASLQTAIEVAVYKHRMERELEEREAWLSAVLSSISDAVIAMDEQTKVRFVNPAAETLTGWSQAEAKQKSLNTVLAFSDAESGESIPDPVPLAIVRDATVEMGTSALMSDRSGKKITVEGEASPVKASGATIGAVVTLRDVSARRWEEQQLRQSQKLEVAARLASSVSSEFENLLAIIHSQCDQLLEQFATTRALRKPLEEIKQAVVAAEQINRRLAGFRTNAAHHREALTLNGIVRRMTRLIESVAGDRITVRIHMDQNAGKIIGDPSQMEQMIMNLAVHCCESMPEGGQLELNTSRANLPGCGNFAKLSIRYAPKTGSSADRGTEVLQQDLDPEKLFEPLLLTEEHNGLAIALKIASNHDGYLEAHRSSGNSVEIDALIPQWIEPQPVPVTPEMRGGPVVLLVDPREIVRAQVHNYFESNGYNLLEASDVNEAITLAEIHEGTLDLVIAPATDAGKIADSLLVSQPSLSILRVVEDGEDGPDRIRSPYTQVSLMEKVTAVLSGKAAPAAAAATT
jgi:two-component system, cell cycle sensor histidine kinase and response regulator CckA